MSTTYRGKGKVFNQDMRLLATVNYAIVESRGHGLGDVEGLMTWHGRPAEVPRDPCLLETDDGRVREISIFNSNTDVWPNRIEVTANFHPTDVDAWLSQEAAR